MLRAGSILVILVLSAAALTLAPASAQAPAIRPGDGIVIDDASLCTLNFVFDGVGPNAGKVYIGTAAHCVGGNYQASFDHIAFGTVFGAQLAPTDVPDFATVAYLGDYPDSVNGGAAVPNIHPGTQLDFALLEVKPAYAAQVDARVRGHFAPVGYTKSAQTVFPDVLLHSGHGIAYSELQATRENHPGVLWSDNSRTFVELGFTVPGDSGGPILHEKTRQAFGVVSGATAKIGVLPYETHGPTIEGILAELASLGVQVKLRTV